MSKPKKETGKEEEPRKQLLFLILYHPESDVRAAAERTLIKRLADSGDYASLSEMKDLSARWYPQSLMDAVAAELEPTAKKALATLAENGDFESLHNVAKDRNLPESIRDISLSYMPLAVTKRTESNKKMPFQIEMVVHDSSIPELIREAVGLPYLEFEAKRALYQRYARDKLLSIATSPTPPSSLRVRAFEIWADMHSANKRFASELKAHRDHLLSIATSPTPPSSLRVRAFEMWVEACSANKDFKPILNKAEGEGFDAEIKDAVKGIVLAFAESLGQSIETADDAGILVSISANPALPEELRTSSGLKAVHILSNADGFFTIRGMSQDERIPPEVRAAADDRSAHAALNTIKKLVSEGCYVGLRSISEDESLPSSVRDKASKAIPAAASKATNAFASQGRIGTLLCLATDSKLPGVSRQNAYDALEKAAKKMVALYLKKPCSISGDVFLLLDPSLVVKEKRVPLHIREIVGLEFIRLRPDSDWVLSQMADKSAPDAVVAAAKKARQELAVRLATKYRIDGGVMSEGTVKPPVRTPVEKRCCGARTTRNQK